MPCLCKYSASGNGKYCLQFETCYYGTSCCVEADYSDERAVECINTDLVNTLCNLVSRCAAKSINPDQVFPRFIPQVFDRLAADAEKDILTNLYKLRGEPARWVLSLERETMNVAAFSCKFKFEPYGRDVTLWLESAFGGENKPGDRKL
jgi:hypothetical protein